MDAATTSFLESATLRTLYAHNFSRSSSEASHVLSDLLARYYTLLAETCARYAEHAGRSSVVVTDAVRALNELGTSTEDLSEFVEGEGRELQKYATSTARRMEELSLLKESLSDGLKLDRDDAIQLVYDRVPSPSPSAAVEEEDSDDEVSDIDSDAMVVELPNGHSSQPEKSRPRSTSPALPPSPISPPMSPTTRKRPRTSNWKADSHIPEFLPPFPTTSPPPTPREPAEIAPSVVQSDTQNRPITPPPQLASSTTSSDYLTAVPYSMSALASGNELHLPELPDAAKLVGTTAKRSLPATNQALVHAYHYILTNPPPPQPALNPLRHKVAMALLSSMYATPRWTSSDTLFGNISPPRPRVVAPTPSYPDPVQVHLESEKGKEKEKRQPLLPLPASRSIAASETTVPLSAQPVSRIPEILQHVLSPAVFSRATKIQPPPVQVASGSNEKFLYGPGVPAPWNSSSSNAGVETSAKGKDLAGGRKDGVSKSEPKSETVADATLYATWDYDTKDYRLPISQPKGRRTGSFSVGGNAVNGLHHRPSISLRAGSVGAESSSSRKVGKLVIKGEGKGG